MHMQKSFQILQVLLAINSITIIAEDLNYNLLKASQNKFLDIFTDDFQMLNKPTHTSRSLIDHDSVKKAFMEGLFINITAEKKFFSDDAIRTVIEKSSVDFHIYL